MKQTGSCIRVISVISVIRVISVMTTTILHSPCQRAHGQIVSTHSRPGRASAARDEMIHPWCTPLSSSTAPQCSPCASLLSSWVRSHPPHSPLPPRPLVRPLHPLGSLIQDALLAPSHRVRALIGFHLHTNQMHAIQQNKKRKFTEKSKVRISLNKNQTSYAVN